MKIPDSLLLIFLLCVSCTFSFGQSENAAKLNSISLGMNKTIFPDSDWVFVDHPEQIGWPVQKLDSFRKYIIDSSVVTGLMIIQKGKVVFQYGDIAEVSYIASCRKSILAILYGEHIKSGEIKLNSTIRDLGIDDIGGLLPIEKEATVRDLLSARSGVFHPASYSGDFLDFAPKRGSVKPGEYWLYSNWDFNMAGYVFEQQTHRDIYDEVDRMLAKPLQMQDWSRAGQAKDGDTTRSKYLAYPMNFSTRDMARIGLLMINNGHWKNKQLVDSAWVAEMIKPRTSCTEINLHIPPFRGTEYSMGYGYLWWLWQNVKDDRLQGGYSAMGKYGQSISMFPAEDVVIAVKTKDAYERDNKMLGLCKIVRLAAECYK
jgi:CubicO group peptidase (beta-lactamase class C family)